METTVDDEGNVTLHIPFTKESLENLLGVSEHGGITDQQWQDFKDKVNWPELIKDITYTTDSWGKINNEFARLACPVKLYSRKKNICQCNCENHNTWNFFGAYADEEIATERMNELIFTGNPVWQEKEFKIVDERIPAEQV